MDGRQQEVRPIGLGYEGIYGLQVAAGYFQVISHHNDGNFRPDLLDLISDDCAIQKAQVIFEHNCIHWP